MPICLLGLSSYVNSPDGWMLFIGAFALFRLFDILKPFGIKRLQRYHGGFGVVADDVTAALVVCLILNVVVRIWL